MTGNCGKGFLYFYNLIFLGISGVLVYLAVLFVWKWGDYTTIAANTYSIVPVGIIFVFGIIVFITGIVGFCGTCNESRCTLGVFFSLLLIILAMEIVAGSLTYVKESEIESELKDNLWKAFRQYTDEHSSTRKPFDKMQHRLDCCGVTGSSNWKNISNVDIPDSCCIHRANNKCSALPDNVFKNGCYEKLIDLFHTNIRYIMGLMIGFGVLQLIGMILSLYMIVVLRKTGYMRMLDTPPKAAA